MLVCTTNQNQRLHALMDKFDGELVCKKHESENDMDTHTDTFDSYFVYIAHENGSDTTHETSVK